MGRERLLLGASGRTLGEIAHLVVPLPSRLIDYIMDEGRLKPGIFGWPPPFDGQGVLQVGEVSPPWSEWRNRWNQDEVRRECRIPMDWHALNDVIVLDSDEDESVLRSAVMQSGITRTTISLTEAELSSLLERINWVLAFLGPEADYLLFACSAKLSGLVAAAALWLKERGEHPFSL